MSNDYNYVWTEQYAWNDANMEEDNLFVVNRYNPWLGFFGSPDDFELTLPSSYPLSHCSSSDGSNYDLSPSASADALGCAVTDSPTIDPTLLELDQQSVPDLTLDPGSYDPPAPILDLITPRSTPTRARSIRSRSSSTSHPNIPCPYCPHKHFKRRADLNRHISHIHQPSSNLSSYRCDYKRCARRDEPFFRRDHFRDHLRDFHREDIEKRNVTVDDAWYQDRYTVPDWWRCSRCLLRVNVHERGFECPTCRGVCCSKRQKVRMEKGYE